MQNIKQMYTIIYYHQEECRPRIPPPQDPPSGPPRAQHLTLSQALTLPQPLSRARSLTLPRSPHRVPPQPHRKAQRRISRRALCHLS